MNPIRNPGTIESVSKNARLGEILGAESARMKLDRSAVTDEATYRRYEAEQWLEAVVIRGLRVDAAPNHLQRWLWARLKDRL